MMLESKKPCESRVSRSWVAGLAVGLVALGLLVGGVGLRAVAAADKPAEKLDDLPKKDGKPEGNKPRIGGDLDRILENFGGIDDEAAKELRQRMDELRKQMDEMRKQFGQGNFNFQGQFPGGAIAFPGGGVMMPGGAFSFGVNARQQRLGAQIRTPSKTLVDQLDLPRDQGLVLEEVGPNSAAAKAGLKPHDILLELDGKSVPSKTEAFLKMLNEIKPNTPVDAVVLRKGKKETVKGLSLPEAKPVGGTNPFALGGLQGLPGVFNVPGGRALGQAVGRGGMTSVVRNNDEFTTKHKEDDVTITIKGTIDAGKAKISEVVIDEGKGQSATYSSLDKVPATHQEKVKKLAEMSAKGVVNFPIR